MQKKCIHYIGLGFFFFSFFLSGCYLPYEPPKEAVFFLQNLVKVFVLLISGQQQSDI